MAHVPARGSTVETSADGAHAASQEPPPPGESPPPRSGSRRRRRFAAAGTLIAVLAAAAALLLSSGSPPRAGAGTGVPAGETATAVTRRTLTESATVDGTLGYGAASELYDRLSGTFTWLPAVGAVVGRGGTLFRVNNLPVVLMYGPVPAYRTLKEGVPAGPDVVELNQNLIALGFDPDRAISDLEVFSEATAAAARRFQHAHGLAETSHVELGRVVFAPGARRVTAVHVQLGQDPSGSPSSESPSKESPSKGAPSKEPSKESPPGKSPGKSPAKESPSKESPAKSPSKEGEGESGGAAEAVLSATSTQQLVQIKLKPEQQQLARVGRSAPVTLPGGNVVTGRVIEVGSVASEAKSGEGGGGNGGESESATIPVTLALERPVAHLDQAPVSVELVKAVRRNVLAVPATALTATAGGGYAIDALEGGRRVELAVTPGMFANGYVQVEGAGVHVGLAVLESE